MSRLIISVIFAVFASVGISFSQDYRVGPEVQKQRDNLRLKILHSELEKEKKLLSEAEARYTENIKRGGNTALLNGIREDIEDHRNNISALQKEITGKTGYKRNKVAKRTRYDNDSPVMLKLGNEGPGENVEAEWWDVYQR